MYQQHWWRRNGPCQHKAPFFGTVRRSMNRVPGPNGFWCKEHQLTCNGQFIKIKKPEKIPKNSKKKSSKNSRNSESKSQKSSILNWINKSPNNISSSKTSDLNNSTHLRSKNLNNKSIPVTNNQSDLKK